MKELSEEELESINQERRKAGECEIRQAFSYRKTVTTEAGTKRKINFKPNNRMYCAGVKKLAKILNVTNEEAKELKKKYFEERC